MASFMHEMKINLNSSQTMRKNAISMNLWISKNVIFNCFCVLLSTMSNRNNLNFAALPRQMMRMCTLYVCA